MQQPLTTVPTPTGCTTALARRRMPCCAVPRYLWLRIESISADRISDKSGKFERHLETGDRTRRRDHGDTPKSLREERQQTDPAPADPPRRLAVCSMVADEHVDPVNDTITLRRNGPRMDASGDGRQCQTAMEARLRRALGRAGRYFETYWQVITRPNPDYDGVARFWRKKPNEHHHELFWTIRPRKSRNPRGTADHRRMADLCLVGKAVRFMYQKPRSAKRMHPPT